MARGFLERNITFWGTVGVVMTALKLKDRYDAYHQVPAEEQALGQGPVALHSPIDEESGRNLPDTLSIDTTISSTRLKRKRSAACCMCCGTKCGLFWKAFGIVCLLFFTWQAVKLVFWLVTPSPTGLEGMPVYSKSLGCADAKFIYNPDQTVYSIPIGISKADSFLIIRGRSVGTIVLAEGSADAEDIKFEMTLRADKKELLDQVQFRYPTIDDIKEGLSQSSVHLDTATNPGSCMRYDIVLRIPPSLKELSIKSSSITQLQFAEDGQIILDSLQVNFQAIGENSDLSMVLPRSNVHAKQMSLATTNGWLVGDVSIVDSTELDTRMGAAVMNVHASPFQAPDIDAEPVTAVLNTYSGNGRADIFYETDSGAPHRPISSSHKVARGRTGDLYLTYKQAEFNGHVNIKSKSWSATGVQGTFNRTSSALPWVGDMNGGDMVTAESPNGWVGLYF